MQKTSLQPNAGRQLSHHRKIDCYGFKRDDGLWDIEAHLVDIKGFTLSITPERSALAAGEHLHEMCLCITVDAHFLIHDAKTTMSATPYDACSQIANRYQQLIGLTIGAGWNKRIRELFGGVNGCTHLLELLGPIATVAFQTVVDDDYRARSFDESQAMYKTMVNGCHGLRDDGNAVKVLWPPLAKS